ncbi:Diuretic hormone [Tyrophagus putrescentiae]|nr:Diuretic hormone [Tyrophagus putrescentiae]
MISSSFFSSSSSTSSVRNFFALSLLSVAVLVLALGHFSTSAEAYPLNLGGGGGNEAMARKHPVALEIENPEEVLSVLDNLMQNILVGIDISHSGGALINEKSPGNKRGIDLGLSRGFSGSQAAKHLMGMTAAGFANGPGRRRK